MDICNSFMVLDITQFNDFVQFFAFHDHFHFPVSVVTLNNGHAKMSLRLWTDENVGKVGETFPTLFEKSQG